MNNDDDCYIKIDTESQYFANMNLWDALKFKDVTNLYESLKHKYVNINTIDNLGRTYLHKFLIDKKELLFDDLRIILIVLNHKPNLDIKDNFDKSARDKLLELGYIVDRKYLKIKQNNSLIENIDDL